MEHSYFNEILILLVAAVTITLVFIRLQLPPLLGYLTVGALLGPYGLAWIADTEHTRAFAEFGVVFLLFSIGLEFSLPQLMQMKGAVLGLGGSQVLISTLATTLIAMYFSFSLESAIILGGVIAMSSTALVTKQLTDQVELHSQHGKNAIGIVLFQDVMVIPFLILVTSLTTSSYQMPTAAVAAAFTQGLLALALILAIGRWVLSPVFRRIAKFRSTELFTLTALLVALGAAWITYKLGLSLVLGAFIAGMMLGETEFRHQVAAEIRPFRDLLLGLFFITIGMLFNTQLLPDIWVSVLLLLAALMIFKLLLIFILCKIAGWNSTVALRTGLVLAHGGEFGFAILALALDSELLLPNTGQIVLAALLMSMALSPLIIRYNGRIASLLLPKVSIKNHRMNKNYMTHVTNNRKEHVIICGYGRVGQNISRILEEEGIPFSAIDIDPVLVQNAIKAKEPVSYGDAGNIELLNAAGLNHAAALVISIDDSHTALKILRKVREVHPKIPVMVRTTDDTQLEHLHQAKATEVIQERMEASLVLVSHLLLRLKVPAPHVVHKLHQARKNHYAQLRLLFPGEDTIMNITDKDTKQLLAIELPKATWATQQCVKDLPTQKYHVSITAIHRQQKRIINPPPNMRLFAGDILIVFGSPNALERIEAALLRSK